MGSLSPSTQASSTTKRFFFAKKNQKTLFHALGIPTLGAVVILTVWEISARYADYPYLPAPSATLQALAQLLQDGSIATALATSLQALIAGLAIAIIAGITIGTLMGLVAPIRNALGLYIDGLMSAPMTAFIPLFMLLFGLGIETRIIVTTLCAFFPIVVNTQAGIEAADPILIEMARSFGAKPLAIFFKVRLPMSFGHIQAGLRMGMARGVEGNVTSEVLIAAVGLGGLVTQYGRAFTTDKLFAIVIVIIALAFTAVALTRLLGHLALGPAQDIGEP